jgi:CubicO group peptidase (beta-lactamase class C family)
MKKLLLFLFLLLNIGLLFSQQTAPAKDYFPPKGTWKKQSPLASGFDTAKLNAAIRFAIKNESRNPRNMELSQKMSFGKEPFGEAIGPFADRGDPTGIIIHRGYIVAEWGEPLRVDMVHSVSKSFLSTVIGVAVDKEVIEFTHLVSTSVWAVQLYDSARSRDSSHVFIYPFKGDHNEKIRWEEMLRQTSDWEGTLWGKPDWADRPDKDSTKWHNRKRNEPGTVWEYNDVRVNALALATTVAWRKPLPEVLKKYIMDPIGASDTWQWNGYKNSWIELDGKPIHVVSGGGHWGGGMFMNTYDMARFGLLTLNRGNWNGKQLVSKHWINQSLVPTEVHPGYGFMNYFLNTDKKYLPGAPETSFAHVGNGANIIYVDTRHELVMVLRWIESNAVDGMVKRVLEGMK